MTLSAQIRALPKLELHRRLAGAIPVDIWWGRLRKYGRPADIGSLGDLERRFTCREPPHFLDHGSWTNGFLRECAVNAAKALR
jgi:hypothetical protein